MVYEENPKRKKKENPEGDNIFFSMFYHTYESMCELFFVKKTQTNNSLPLECYMML